jgi:hydrogenase-4 component F
VIADGALGPVFARTLLAAMALASLLLAATLLLGQQDYKRMLAYSSIEHLALVAFGAAIGGSTALTAVLLHVLGHGLAKAVLFLGAGRVLQVTGTSRIDGVRGLSSRQPMLAGCLGAGVFALIGLPPFSLFASELGIARAGFAAGLGWITAAVLVLVLVIAAAMTGHSSRMLLGSAPAGHLGEEREVPRLPAPAAVALVGGLLACALLGLTAGPLSSVLSQATQTLTGPR